MKYIVLLFFTVFCSCSKTVVSLSKDDLAGVWILKQVSGGIAGSIKTPTDQITLNFETSGKYTSTLNYAITAEGRYTIAKAGEPNYYYSETLINLISDSSQVTYGITLQNDSLSLSEGCCDQFNYLYVRQK